MGITIGVDVGGTKIAAGAVDEDGNVLASTRMMTPAGFTDDITDAIAEVVAELRAHKNVAAVDAVGLGAAGFIDRTRSRVLVSPNLNKAWRNEPLRDRVSAKVNLPVVVENDANAAAWGEFKFGAGRGLEDAIVLTVGTGIGGGLILDRRLIRGHWGVAAEVGHITAVVGGRRCGCGNRGCWEQYVSGRALIREAREIASVEPGRARRLLDLGGGVPEGILGPHVTLAAREGDGAAREVFDVMGRWLGFGMAVLAAVLDPGLFIISGGVSEAGDLLIAPTRAAFGELLTGHDARPEAGVVLAELGNGAGVVGAADLARYLD